MLENLPHEILIQIIMELPPEKIVLLSLANKILLQASHDDKIWRTLYNKDFAHLRKKTTLTDNWYDSYRQTYQAQYNSLKPPLRSLFSICKRNNKEQTTIFLQQFTVGSPKFSLKNKFDFVLTSIKRSVLTTSMHPHQTYNGYLRQFQLAQIKKLLSKVDGSKQSFLDWAKRSNNQILSDWLYRFFEHPSNLYTAETYHEQIMQLDSSYRNLFYWSIVLRQFHRTKQWLSIPKILDIHYTSNQFSALHLAVLENDIDLAHKILTIKPSLINQADGCGQNPLILAANKGFIETVELLLSQPNINLNNSTKTAIISKYNGRTALIWAIIEGHTYIASLLINAGANLTERACPDGYQAIHFAVSKNQQKIAELLIQQDPSLLNVKTTVCGFTPLMIATLKNQFRLVQFLVKAGADINLRNQQGKTAFHLVCERGYFDIVQFLLDQGCVLSDCADYFGANELHLAARSGQTEIASLLLSKDPSLLNSLDKFNQTPLLHAAANGHLAVVKLFLSYEKINIHKRSNFTRGKTALSQAAKNGHLDIVKILVDAGALNKKNTKKPLLPPLCLAAENGRYSIVTYFIGLRPELLNKGDEYNQTPLILASCFGHLDIVDYLLAQENIDLEVTSGRMSYYSNTANRTTSLIYRTQGNTALHYAIEREHTQIALRLIKAGANLQAASGEQRSLPWHKAAIKGNILVLQAMFALNPELINCKNGYGQTALYLALMNSHLAAADYLIKCPGIDLNDSICDLSENKTIIHHAVEFNHYFIVDYALEAKADPHIGTPFNTKQPVHSAALTNNVQIMSRLLSVYPHLVNATNNLNQTPLMLAAKKGNTEMVKFLLKQKGIHLHLSCNDRFKAIDYARLSNNAACEEAIAKAIRRERNTNSFSGFSLTEIALQKIKYGTFFAKLSQLSNQELPTSSPKMQHYAN